MKGGAGRFQGGGCFGLPARTFSCVKLPSSRLTSPAIVATLKPCAASNGPVTPLRPAPGTLRGKQVERAALLGTEARAEGWRRWLLTRIVHRELAMQTGHER